MSSRRGSSRLGLIAATMLALVGCSLPGSGDEAAAERGSEAKSVLTLAIAEGGAGGCAATWNGEAVTRDGLIDRSIDELERLIAEVGGVANLQELPIVRVEAGNALGWPCARSWLATLQEAGFAQVHLVTGEGDPSGPRLSFPLPGMPPPGAIVTAQAGARFLWDGEPVDAAGLRQRRDLSGTMVNDPPPGNAMSFPEPVVPPGDFMIVGSDEADVGAVREAARIMSEGGIEPLLSTADPAAAAAPSG